MMTLHFLNHDANDAESTHTKKENYVIVAGSKSDTMSKLINRIPGLPLLIQVYQARL